MLVCGFHRAQRAPLIFRGRNGKQSHHYQGTLQRSSHGREERVEAHRQSARVRLPPQGAPVYRHHGQAPRPALDVPPQGFVRLARRLRIRGRACRACRRRENARQGGLQGDRRAPGRLRHLGRHAGDHRVGRNAWHRRSGDVQPGDGQGRVFLGRYGGYGERAFGHALGPGRSCAGLPPWRRMRPLG